MLRRFSAVLGRRPGPTKVKVKKAKPVAEVDWDLMIMDLRKTLAVGFSTPAHRETAAVEPKMASMPVDVDVNVTLPAASKSKAKSRRADRVDALSPEFRKPASVESSSTPEPNMTSEPADVDVNVAIKPTPPVEPPAASKSKVKTRSAGRVPFAALLLKTRPQFRPTDELGETMVELLTCLDATSWSSAMDRAVVEWLEHASMACEAHDAYRVALALTFELNVSKSDWLLSRAIGSPLSLSGVVTNLCAGLTSSIAGLASEKMPIRFASAYAALAMLNPEVGVALRQTQYRGTAVACVCHPDPLCTAQAYLADALMHSYVSALPEGNGYAACPPILPLARVKLFHMTLRKRATSHDFAGLQAALYAAAQHPAMLQGDDGRLGGWVCFHERKLAHPSVAGAVLTALSSGVRLPRSVDIVHSVIHAPKTEGPVIIARQLQKMQPFLLKGANTVSSGSVATLQSFLGSLPEAERWNFSIALAQSCGDAQITVSAADVASVPKAQLGRFATAFRSKLARLNLGVVLLERINNVYSTADLPTPGTFVELHQTLVAAGVFGSPEKQTQILASNFLLMGDSVIGNLMNIDIATRTIKHVQVVAVPHAKRFATVLRNRLPLLLRDDLPPDARSTVFDLLAGLDALTPAAEELLVPGNRAAA